MGFRFAFGDARQEAAGTFTLEAAKFFHALLRPVFRIKYPFEKLDLIGCPTLPRRNGNTGFILPRSNPSD